MLASRRLTLLAAATLVGACSASAPPGGAPPAGAPAPRGADAAFPALDAIREADLRRDLYALAGDHFRGREAGTLDELRASVWLAEQARAAGLEPAGDDGTYFQWWSIRRYRISDDSRIAIDGQPVRLFAEAAVLAPVDTTVDAPILFVEPGAPVDSAAVRGRVVATELVPPADVSAAALQRYGPGAVRRAAAPFVRLGAAAVVVVSDTLAEARFGAGGDLMERGRYGVDSAGFTAYWPDARGGARRPQGGAPVIWVRRALLDRLRAPDARLTARLTTENFLYPSVNIVGRVPGTDPALRDEYVLYSGHQDHDGVRTAVDGDSIWNGADDNGTVSVAMLAIARAFHQAPGRRPVLFVWHGAEERGLLGSRHFVMHPTVPKEQIAAVLNADMIGRNDPDSAALLGAQPPHRNSTALVEMALRANQTVTRFALDTLWDRPTHRERWYFRSDHLPYARAGVPAIEFSTNLHPDYHTPRDEPGRIDYAKLARMTRWMYATGWLVANAAQRPGVDPGFRLER
ncbi:MAG TPA: M28 family peptidase [Gemmatimonadaceae bacterium]|nr:M28 family peptidase [Gemmatimonadaceae bacterium]